MNSVTSRGVMRTVAVFAILVIVSAGLLMAAGKPEEEGQKSAAQWLSLVDAGKYAESWKAAAGAFQAAVPQEQWERSLGAVRQPLGDVVSRKLRGAKFMTSLPGAPDGEYVVLQFDTSFAHKKEAVETITPMRDKDGQWKVSGYFIK